MTCLLKNEFYRDLFTSSEALNVFIKTPDWQQTRTQTGFTNLLQMSYYGYNFYYIHLLTLCGRPVNIHITGSSSSCLHACQTGVVFKS